MAIQDREIEYDAVMGRVVTGPSCTSSKDTFIANAMGALAGDTRNADRLNNAAVALFWLSMGDRYGVRAAALGRFRRGEGSSVFDAARANAYFLLNQIETTFAPNRAALLNYSGPRKRNTKGGTFKVGDDKTWDNNIQPPTKPVSCKSCSGRTKPWSRLPRRAGCIRINGGAGKRSPSRACRACSTGAMRRSILKPRTSSRSRTSTRKSDA